MNYTFRDNDTDEQFTMTMTLAEFDALPMDEDRVRTLPDGRKAWVDVAAQQSGVPKRNAGYPFYSDGAGVHPDEIPAAQALLKSKGVHAEFHPETGQCKMESREHRAKVLKARGFHDRNGGYMET